MKWNDVSDVVLVSLLLTLNIFHGLSWCFLCFRTSKYRLGIHLNNQVFWGLTTNSLIKNTYWLFFFDRPTFESFWFYTNAVIVVQMQELFGLIQSLSLLVIRQKIHRWKILFIGFHASLTLPVPIPDEEKKLV